MTQENSEESDDGGRDLPVSPYLLLPLAPLFWSSNFIVGRAIRDDFPPITLNWCRWTTAALILIAIAWPRVRREWREAARHWRLLAVLGFAGMTVFHSSIYLGLARTTAVNAGIIMATGPVTIVILAWLILGTRLKPAQIAGVAISLAGVVLIVSRAEWQVIAGLRPNPGDLWVLLAATSWGVYSVMLRRKPPALDPTVFLIGVIVGSLVFTTPLMMWEAASGRLPAAKWESAGAVLYVAVFASVIAYFCWNRGIAEIGPAKAGLFLHLIPIFAAVLSWLILGEGLAPYHFAGFVLIVSGIFLTSRGGAPG